MKIKWLDIMALALIIISALNGGLLVLFQFNLLNTLLGPVLEKVISAIIGLAVIYLLWRGSQIKRTVIKAR